MSEIIPEHTHGDGDTTKNAEPKKILIAMPTLGLDPDPEKWLSTFIMITNAVRRAKMSHACIFPFRKTWWPSNNMIWETAFNYEFDYILRIDDDIWGGSPDDLTKLLDADKDVIGASYAIRQFPYSMCAFNRTNKEESLIDSWVKRDSSAMTEVSGVGVHPCDLVGFGMTLIKVAPFKALNRNPMYQGEEVCPDDTYLAQVCLDNGIQQYVHLDVKFCHRDVTPINRMYLFNAEARALIRGGVIKRGNTFHDRLINTFGEDGLKEFGQLKGMEVSRIITK